MERLNKDTWVRSVAHISQGGWVTPNNRRPCAFGQLTGRSSDSHRLCYEVRHADGTKAYYDDDELIVVTADNRLSVEQRWANEMPHHSRSEHIYSQLAEADTSIGDDRFGFKAGGDGDNGEHLMYLLDDLIDRGVI